MRKSLMIAAGFAALAAPAAGQPYPDVPAPMDPRDEEIVRNLPSQPEIEAMGEVLDRTMDAVLQVPIGPIVEAANPGRPMSRREREETLGERASRDDPSFRERMREQIDVAGIALGALAEQMAVMTPVLRRTLEDTQRRIDAAVRGAPPPPEYEARYEPEADPADEEYTPIEPQG